MTKLKNRWSCVFSAGDEVGGGHVFEAVGAADRQNRAFRISVDDVCDHGVGQVAVNDHGAAGVADDVGNGDVAHAVALVFSVTAAVAEQKRAAGGFGDGRSIDHAVDHDVVDLRQRRQQADGEAEIGVGDDVSDDDIVDVFFALSPVVVHDVRCPHRSAGQVIGICDGGQGDHIVAGIAGDVGNDDMVAAVADVDAVLVFHVHAHTVDLFVHRGGKVDLFHAAVCAGLERDAPPVRFLDPQVGNRKVFDVGEQNADSAPVAVLRLAGVAGVGAVGVVVDIPKIELVGAAALFGNPVGIAADVLGHMRAGNVQQLRAVTACARVIRAGEQAEALAADVDIFHALGELDANTAVGRAEKVVAAAVGELERGVLQNDGGVGRQQDRAVEKPMRAAVRIFARRNKHDAVAATCGDRLFKGFVVGTVEIIVDVDHKNPPKFVFCAKTIITEFGSLSRYI